MSKVTRLGWQMASLLALVVFLGAYSYGQEEVIDGPPGTQEVFNGTSVHVCPLGFAMLGAHVSDNRFTCVRVVPRGREHEVHTILDTGTQHDYCCGNMHVCPGGMYMRGLHDGNNWLVCSDGADVVVEGSFVDQHGDHQANGMHVCPTVDQGRITIMTGIHNGRNDFACARYH